MWIFILNVAIWVTEVCIRKTWHTVPLIEDISTYVIYTFLLQVFTFIIIPILSIVSHKNVFFRNTLNVVTKLINFTYGKNQIPEDMFNTNKKNKKTKKIILPYDRGDN